MTLPESPRRSLLPLLTTRVFLGALPVRVLHSYLLVFYLCGAEIHIMRIERKIPHPRFTITIFSWNEKYIIKIEDAHLEQVYKIDKSQVSGINEVESMLSTPFLLTVLKRFGEMGTDFQDAWKNRYAESAHNTST